MVLNEVLDAYELHYFIKIINHDNKLIYVDCLANLSKPGTHGDIDVSQIGLTGTEEVEKLVTALEVTSKEWKEKNLIRPILPERTPQLTFSDLQVSQYYEIHLSA